MQPWLATGAPRTLIPSRLPLHVDVAAGTEGEGVSEASAAPARTKPGQVRMCLASSLRSMTKPQELTIFEVEESAARTKPLLLRASHQATTTGYPQMSCSAQQFGSVAPKGAWRHSSPGPTQTSRPGPGSTIHTSPNAGPHHACRPRRYVTSANCSASIRRVSGVSV